MASSNIVLEFVTRDCRMVGYSDLHGGDVITSPVVEFEEGANAARTRSGTHYSITFSDTCDEIESLEKLRNAETTVS